MSTASAFVQRAFRPQVHPILGSYRRGMRDLEARQNARRAPMMSEVTQPSLADKIAEARARGDLKLEQMDRAGEIATISAEAGREYGREMGETGFGRQKELAGIKEGFTADAATLGHGRALETLGESHRLGQVGARAHEEFQAGESVLGRSHAQEIQEDRFGHEKGLMTSRLAGAADVAEAGRKHSADEGFLNRLIQERMQGRQHRFLGEQAEAKAGAEAGVEARTQADVDEIQGLLDAGKMTTQDVAREAMRGDKAAQIVWNQLKAVRQADKW